MRIDPQSSKPTKAQRDYYKLLSASAALPARIATLHHHALIGSVLDVGCNDGTLTKALLDAGRVTRAQGVDLEILHQHFPVSAADILTISPVTLGAFDNVLYLNIHHHLVAATHGTPTQGAPQRLLGELLANCHRLFFEMGSLTEKGNWGWLKILRQQFANDDAARVAILGDRLFYEVLRHPMQGGERRMLVVMGNAPDHWAVKNVQWYARNVAAYPPSKRLREIPAPGAFPPGPVGPAVNNWMPDVKFVTFDYGQKKFFGKLHDRKKYNLPLTLKIYDELRHSRFADQIVQPLYFSTKFGFVWEYDPELMMAPWGKALVVHLHDVTQEQFGLNVSPHREDIQELAELKITIDGESKSVRKWCDFQTVKTSKGLRFIDFDAF